MLTYRSPSLKVLVSFIDLKNITWKFLVLLLLSLMHNLRSIICSKNIAIIKQLLFHQRRSLSTFGHCNEIVCSWSPPASLLGAIQKNYYCFAHEQLRNAWSYSSWDMMVIRNAAVYLNWLQVFGWQIMKTITPINMYTTILHTSDCVKNGCVQLSLHYCFSYSLFCIVVFHILYFAVLYWQYMLQNGSSMFTI